MMAVKIFTAQVGLKLSTSLSSANYFDGQISITKGESFRFKVNLPNKDVDLFHVRSARYGIQNNKEIALSPTLASSDKLSVCTKNLMSVAGIAVCLSASTRHIFTPSSLLTGSLDARVMLKKTDPNLEGFLIEGSYKRAWDTEGNLNFVELSFLFNAPGSTLIHDRFVNFVFNRPKKAVALHVHIPRIALDITGSIYDSEFVKLFNITANMNSKRYGLSGQITVDGQEDRVIYGTDVHALTPSGQTSLLTGFVVIVRGQSLEVNFRTLKPETRPLSFKASVEKSSKLGIRKFDTNLEVVLPHLNLSVVGVIQLMKKEMSMGFSAIYLLDSSSTEKTLNFSSKLSNLSTTQSVKLSAISDLQSSQWPEASIQMTWIYQRLPEYLENIIHVRHGVGYSKQVNIVQTWKHQGSWFAGLSSSGIVLVSQPESSQPLYEMQFVAQTEPRKSANFTLLTHLKSSKRFSGNLLLQNFTSHLMNYKAVLQIETPARKIELKEVLIEKTKQEYHGDVYFQWQKGHHSSLSYIHKDRSSKYVISHELEMRFSKYNMKIPLKIAVSLHAQNRSYEVSNSLEKDGLSVYSVNGNYRQPNRESTMANANIHLPWLNGDFELHSKPHFKAGTINIDFTGQRNIIGSYKTENMNGQSDFVVEVQWDAKRNPEKKLKTFVNIKGPVGQQKADVAFSLETPIQNFKGIVSYDIPPIFLNGKHFLSGKIEYAPDREASCVINLDITQLAEEYTAAGKVNFYSLLTDKVEIMYKRFSKQVASDKDEQIDVKVEGKKLAKSQFRCGYKLNPNELGTRLEIRHDAHYLNLVLGGELHKDTDRQEVLGGFSFHSSVPYLKQVVLEFALGKKSKLDERRLYHTSTLKWDESISRLNMDYVHKQLLHGVSWVASSNFTLPHFQHGTQSFMLQVIKEDQPFRYYLQVDTTFSGKKRMSKIDMRCSSTSNKHMIQLSLPFTDIQPLILQVHNAKDNFNVSTAVSVKWSIGQEISWTSTRVWSSTTAAINIIIKTPFEYFTSINIQGSTSQITDEKQNVVILIGSGSNSAFSLNIVIDILKPDRGFNASLTLNSPGEMYHQWSAKALQTLADGTRTTAVEITFGDVKFRTLLIVDYLPDGFLLTGNLHLNDEELVKGSLTTTEKSAVEAGVQTTTYHLLLHGLPVTVDSEATITKSKPGYDWMVKTCFLPETDYCSYLQLRVFRAFDQLHNRTTKEWLVKSTISNFEQKRTSGFHTTFVSDPSLIHHDAKLLWDEEEHRFVSYNIDVTKQDNDQKAVLEVQLPSRLMRVIGQRQRQVDNKSGIIQLDVQMDVTDRPDRKFTLQIETRDVASEPKEIAWLHTATVKTPDIIRPLFISSLLEVDDSVPAVVSLTAELDLSQDPRRKLILRSIVKRDSSDQPNYSVIWAAKQDQPAPINIMLEAKTEQSNSTRFAVAKLSWLNRHKLTRSALLQTVLNMEMKQYLVTVSSPMKSFKLRGNWSQSSVAEGVLFKSESQLNVDGRVQRQLFIEMSKRPRLDVKYFLQDEKGHFFHVHGALPDHKTLIAEVDRHYGGLRIEDSSLLMKLNTSRLLHTVVKWRPGAVGEATIYAQHQISSIQKYFIDWGELIISEVDAELEDKSNNMWEVIDLELWPLMSIIATNLKLAAAEFSNSISIDEISDVLEDLKEVLSERFDVEGIIGAYEEIRNQLFDFLDSHLTELKEMIQELFDSTLGAVLSSKWMLHSIKDGLVYAAAHCKDWWLSTIEVIGRMSESVLKMWSTWGIESALEDALEKVNSAIEKISQKAIQWLDAICSYSAYYFESIAESIYKFLHFIPSWFKQCYDSALENSSFMQLLVDKIQYCASSIQMMYFQLVDATVTEDAKETIFPAYNTSDVLKFLEYLNAVSRETYNHMKSGEYVRQHWLAAVSQVRSLALQLWHLDCDMEKGLIDVQFPLLIPVYSLRDLPRVISRGSYAPSKFNSLLDKFYKMKAIIQSRYVLPPFPAYGVLIGTQDFITFDQRTFRFAGPCQYLLATDFYGNAFSVIIKYHSQPLSTISRSLLFIADGHHVDIQANSQVLLDGQQMELPIEIETLSIERKGSKVSLYDSKGTEISCDFEADFCLLRINGFYFGKTAGLFGTYDYEPSNDFKLPSRENTSHITQFASSWEVGRECITVKNLATEPITTVDNSMSKLCEDLFNYHFSSLRPCYVQISPEPYLHVCKKLVAQTKRSGLCQVAAAYMATCSYESIYLSPPPQCVTCEDVDGQTLQQGEVEELKGSHIQRSVDVVFVVEQRNCNRHVRVDLLEDLSRELEKELRAQKFHNNRYAVVGFGGHGNQHSPHVHTMNGQLFATARSVQLATKNMEFGTNGVSDTFTAIQLATKLNFRPGIAKVIILLTCSSCKEATMSVKYSEVQQLLLNRGITLHYLNPEAVKMKVKPQVSKQIIGVDAYTIYKGKDVTQKTLVGEPDLRSQVILPRDLCIALAQEVNGSFFRSSELHTKGVAGKNFKMVLVRRIALSAQPPTCQRCECNTDNTGHGLTICRPCETFSPIALDLSDSYDADEDSELKENTS